MNEASRIRVCFVSFKAYPIFNPTVEKVFGGAEVDLYLLATELAKDARYDVRFVVGDYGQPDGQVREGVTLYKCVKSDRFMLLEGGKVWRALKRADADIYMHEACSLGTVLAAMFYTVHRRKFVYRTAHTDETDGTYFRDHPIRKYFVKWAIQRADVLITQNENDVDDAIRTFGRKPDVIGNACRIHLRSQSQRKGILWVARSVSFKRPELFLQLAESFPDKPFIMICPQGSGDTRYEGLVEAARKVNNLTFIKGVSFQEVDRYFEQAELFVNTSDSEGFPNTFVQAARSGTPILSLRVNPDHFLETQNCGRCANGQWERFCALLQELTETPLGGELGQNGQTYIRTFHDIEKIIGLYKCIFEVLWDRKQ